MASDGLGEFEQLLLLATLRLGHEIAYAVTIRTEIEKTAKRKVARGAVYTTLDRLEKKGYLASRVESDGDEGDNRTRRYYRVTAAGMAALRSARATLFRFWQGVEPLLGGSK